MSARDELENTLAPSAGSEHRSVNGRLGRRSARRSRTVDVGLGLIAGFVAGALVARALTPTPPPHPRAPQPEPRQFVAEKASPAPAPVASRASAPLPDLRGRYRIRAYDLDLVPQPKVAGKVVKIVGSTFVYWDGKTYPFEVLDEERVRFGIDNAPWTYWRKGVTLSLTYKDRDENRDMLLERISD